MTHRSDQEAQRTTVTMTGDASQEHRALPEAGCGVTSPLGRLNGWSWTNYLNSRQVSQNGGNMGSPPYSIALGIT